MPEDSHARQLRHELSEQLSALRVHFEARGCPGNVPARPCKADHQFVIDWIGHCNCNDGNAAGRLFGRTGSRRAQGDNDINLMLNQFNSDCSSRSGLYSKFALEADIVSFAVTKLSQPCDQGIESHATCVGALGGAGRGTAHIRAIFCPCCACAASDRAAVAPPSSRLMNSRRFTRSPRLFFFFFFFFFNFVGSSTGKSAGFAPSRILCTRTALRRNISGTSAPYEIRPPASANCRSTEADGKRYLIARSATVLEKKMP